MSPLFIPNPNCSLLIIIGIIISSIAIYYYILLLRITFSDCFIIVNNVAAERLIKSIPIGQLIMFTLISFLADEIYLCDLFDIINIFRHSRKYVLKI